MHSSVSALSPLDGRYADRVEPLRGILSEYGLIRFRLHVEIEWLIALAANRDISELPTFSEETVATLRQLRKEFSVEDAQLVKDIERQTNHDVKALEYYLKDNLKNFPQLDQSLEFIHFGCTSYDINDNCFGMMLKEARDDVLVPALNGLISKLSEAAAEYAEISMLARTHGQAAAPTTVGKEFRVFACRLEDQVTNLKSVRIRGKLSGAVGNFNSLYAAYPDIDWPRVAGQFVESLGLACNPITTQTEPHDYIAEYCHAVQRINSILLDLSRDIWGYIAWGYFHQKIVEQEVGSSAMPHKINPIDFENAEGNLGIANALLGHMAEKLPVSRWQRDLSDSTVLRNLGVGFGHSLISYQSIETGLSKLEPNIEKISEDLDNAWEVLSEAIQTVLRKHGAEFPYEQLKKLTRGVTMSKELIVDFIEGLNLPQNEIQKLLELSPLNYIGNAIALAKDERNK